MAKQFDDAGRSSRQEGASRQEEAGSQGGEGFLNQMNEAPVHPLDQLLHRKPVRVHVQEFSIIIGIVLIIIASVWAYKQRPISDILGFLIAASVLIVVGYRAPAVLKPVWEAWMKLAEVLGKVMTFLLISIMWFGMFVPLAIILRVIGKEVMNMKFRDPNLATYWETRDIALSDFKLVERQY